MRVLAAMSGGVDSAVAAARVVDAGHDVVGVHLALSRSPAQQRTGSRGCCSVEDAGDARRSADVLGIPFYVWDLAERFEADVVDDFVAAYAAGRTPNPCIRCNERIKFSALLDRALALGFDAVATGHYARVQPGDDGTGAVLRRAADDSKDQSYVLASVRPDRLAHAVFPLGEVRSKVEVRDEAARRGLAVADKPDSHDICFVPDGDTADWLQRRLGSAPGPVVDVHGTQVGSHQGTHRFTVGQRRGLQLDRPGPGGAPRYVLSITPTTRTVTVGAAADLLVDELSCDDPVWSGPPPLPGTAVTVQVRAHARPVPAVVQQVAGQSVLIRPVEPIAAVAPGQTVAVYDGDRVLGAVRAA